MSFYFNILYLFIAILCAKMSRVNKVLRIKSTYSQPTKHAKNYGINIFDYEGLNQKTQTVAFRTESTSTVFWGPI